MSQILNPSGGGGGGGTITSVTTSNATPQFVLAGTVENVNFGITNLILGSSATLITSASQTAGYGNGVLQALTSGAGNSIFGDSAGVALNTGGSNCIFGVNGAGSLQSSSFNAGFGQNVLFNLVSGNGFNVAVGPNTLVNLISGDNHTAIGNNAGSALDGAESSDIYIGNFGVSGESHTTRIGTQGSGSGQQNTCFIAGIVGVTTTNTQLVTVDTTTGQLGAMATSALISSKITTFTSNGSWTLDPRTKSVEFFAWGGGAGGGSGRCGVSAAAGGGGGGGNGALVYLKALAANLPSSPYTVTIGAGGAGGASVNATTTNGNPGIIGGITSIGTIVIALGGSIGSAGTTGGGAAASSLFFSLVYIASAISSGAGSSSSASPAVNASMGWGTGGGGGSGYTTATPRVGAPAASIIDLASNTLVIGGLGGANTGATAGNGNSPSGQLFTIGGTGGGGGGNDGGAVTPVAGAGGNGATPGGGGGGGAGTLSGNPSGAGGNGARGQAIIIEYF
jgi:hypothetical protein